MENSSGAAFVNGAMLRRYIGQKVRAVVQVIRSDVGTVIGKSTDDQQIVIKGSSHSPLTTYLEVIGIAESDNTIRAEVWTNFGDSFDAQNYNELCNYVSLQMVSLDTCSSELQWEFGDEC